MHRGCAEAWFKGAAALLDDPLGFDAGDSNLYRYVNNAPTNGTDPSGLADVEATGDFDGGKTSFAGTKLIERAQLMLGNTILGILYGDGAIKITRTAKDEEKAPTLAFLTGLDVKINASITNMDDSKNYYWAQKIVKAPDLEAGSWDSGNKEYKFQTPKQGTAGSPRVLTDVPGGAPGIPLENNNFRKAFIKLGLIVEANGAADYNPLPKAIYDQVQVASRKKSAGKTLDYSFTSYLYYKKGDDDVEKGHWDWSFDVKYSDNTQNAPTVNNAVAKWTKAGK